MSLPTQLDLSLVLTLDVSIGPPLALGMTSAGGRFNYAITGGQFYGAQLHGQVLPGGADFYLERGDGVGVLDARYSLLTDDGVLINIQNTGVLTLNEEGKALEKSGIWPIPESTYQCYCRPVFQVAIGKYQWLESSMFYGRVIYPSADMVKIGLYLAK